MRPVRPFLLLLLFTPATLADEVFLVKGDPFKADVVKVTDKEVAYKQGDKTITRSIKEVLKIELRDAPRPPAGTRYARVELTDGTILLAGKWLLKGKEAELTLLDGKVVKLPVKLLSNVLNPGERDDYVREWRPRISRLRGKEALVTRKLVKDEKNEIEVISNLEVVLGEGDATGTSINFAISVGGKVETGSRKIAPLHGVVFKNALPAQAPPVACRLLDVSGNLVLVSGMATTARGFEVTTPAGAKFEIPVSQVAVLDYQPGRFEFLADLEPSKEVVGSNLDDKDAEQRHVKKRPVSIGGSKYAKGLFILPQAELTYDLRGDFRELSLTVGKDDGTNMVNDCVLVLETENRELKTLTITPQDRPQALTLNVKDAQLLKITVKTGGSEFDLGTHLALGDPRLVK